MHSVAYNADVSSDYLSLVGQTIDSKFTIRSLIGVGGTSLVYDGWHEVLQHAIAVKVLRTEYATDPELAAHFSLEGRVTAQLCGPHVVRVLDTGTMEGRVPYTVMERLRGESVAELLAAFGALPPALALELAIQSCDALVEAHAHGIVHRDVKPDNLYIVDLPNGGQLLKVIDFGIAQGTQIPTGLRKAGVGSAGYMAPEQISSPDSVDWRADVWAMGVVLFEMLTGRLPFRGTTIDELMASAQKDEPLPIEVAAQGLPHELYTLIAGCLRKDPNQRIGSMREVQAELERLRPAVQSSTRAVALPLRLCELGRTLLPNKEDTYAADIGPQERGQEYRGTVHRSGLISRGKALAREHEEHQPTSTQPLPMTRRTDTAQNGLVPSSGTVDFRPKRVSKSRLALGLALLVGLGVGAFDESTRSDAVRLVHNAALPLLSRGSPAQSAHILSRDVVPTSALVWTPTNTGVAIELAQAEPDIAQDPVATPPPRALPARLRRAEVNSLKQPPAPAPSSEATLELLTPWAGRE